MEPDFYTKRTQRLLLSGYPVELSTVDCTLPDAPIIHWHWHEEVEFVYIRQGQAYITCDECNLLATTGDIIFINQKVRHFITPAGDEGVLFSSIILNPSFILGLNQLELENKYLNPIIADRTFNCLHVTGRDNIYQQFQPLIKELITLNEDCSCGYELLSKAYILQLWKLLYDQLPVQSADSFKITARTANQDAQRANQAILYIQEHFMETITLDDIANSILVSKSECCRCFKRATGLSPIEYLMKYRITEATKYMHRKTLDSISEIASAVGFNNTSYFNKTFKKFIGCTPTEYRQSLRKKISSPFL